MGFEVLRMAMSVTRAHLLMVLYEKLAGLELLGVHHVQQLPPCSIGRLQILPVELLHSKPSCKQTPDHLFRSTAFDLASGMHWQHAVATAHKLHAEQAVQGSLPYGNLSSFSMSAREVQYR